MRPSDGGDSDGRGGQRDSRDLDHAGSQKPPRGLGPLQGFRQMSDMV